MSKISTETRHELVTATQDRYRAASLLDKQRILDEFVVLTGYHRKHAIRVLGSGSSTDAKQVATPPRERIYGEAVGEALGMLWEAADRVCGKRLKPLLPTLIAALERHGHLTLDPVVRERLLSASAATIDRLLATRLRPMTAVRIHVRHASEQKCTSDFGAGLHAQACDPVHLLLSDCRTVSNLDKCPDTGHCPLP